MERNDFIKQLSEIKKKFLKFAKENSYKIDNKTFEINVSRFYLTMRIEAEDKDKDTIVFFQEIEQDDSETYQNKLIPSYIQIID